MKIIEHGIIPEQRPPWPIAYHFSCRNCRCQFQIEEGDTFRQETERSFNGKSEIWINCPDCSILLTFSRNNYFDPMRSGRALAEAGETV